MRPQPDFPVLAEDRAREAQQGALEVGQCHVGVDREPLDLVELGHVRGVRIRPVGATGNDDVQRRRVLLHRANLHRRRVRTKDHRAGVEYVLRRLDVERVGLESGGVCDAVVERIEVVVDGLDLGTLGDVEAKPDEHVFEFAPRLCEQV